LTISKDIIMVWPAVIGAAASIGGSLLGNSSARKEAKKNRQWQEYMSNTAYQRAMKDMEAAGLNPMLAYMHGGASTPSGSTASQSSFTGDAGDIISNSKTKSSAVELTQATTAKTKADTAKSIADTELASAQAAETRERTTTYAPSIQHVLSQASLNSVQYNKVLKEIDQLNLQGRLTEANTKESLAKAGLTSAQISEVLPRIMHLKAETSAINEELPLRSLKGDWSKVLNLPEIVRNSAKSNSDGESFGTRLYDFLHPPRDSEGYLRGRNPKSKGR